MFGRSVVIALVLPALERIEHTLKTLVDKDTHMAINFTDLIAKVSTLETAQSSAVTLLQTLTAELKAIGSQTSDTQTQAQIDALTQRLDADGQTLAQAIVANTPTDPTPQPAA